MNAPSLSCAEAIEFLADYIEHVLDTETLIKFERHLEICESCLAYLHTYEQTVRMAKHAAAEEIEDAPEELLEAIIASRRRAGH